MLSTFERMIYRVDILKLLGFGFPRTPEDYNKRATAIIWLRVLSLIVIICIFHVISLVASILPPEWMFFVFLLVPFVLPIAIVSVLILFGYGNRFYVGGLMFIIKKRFYLEVHDLFLYSDPKLLYRELIGCLPSIAESGAFLLRLDSHIFGKWDEKKLMRIALTLVNTHNSKKSDHIPSAEIHKVIARRKIPGCTYFLLWLELRYKRKAPRSRFSGCIEISFAAVQYDKCR